MKKLWWSIIGRMKNKLHLLLAPDSFKGCMRATDVCRHLKIGFSTNSSSIEITELPLADGGEGTVEALVNATHGEYCKTQVHDPLMRIVEAEYGMMGDGRTAVIEMATASGLELLDQSEYNPLITTTYGTGELIKDALDKGCRRFIIGIGGSATNDGGSGMLEALGAKLLNKNSHQTLPKGGSYLNLISGVDFSTLDNRLKDSVFEIACDVTNPLTGPEGATYIYGRQKGGRTEDLEILEQGIQYWGEILEETTDRSIVDVPGSGAAGGLGGGFLSLPNVELKSGFEIIGQAVDLEGRIEQADVVITGEGKVDDQTIFGKVVAGVGKLAARHQKPVICLSGTLGSGSDILLDNGITALFSIVNRPMTLDQAIQSTPQLLEESARNLRGLMVALKWPEKRD